MTKKVDNEDYFKRLNNQPIVNEDGEIIELPRFRTLNNLHLFPKSKGVVNNEPSKTIPGQAMSVSDLLKRYNAGLSIPSADMEYLENENPLPLIKDLTDLSEMKVYMDSLKEKIEVAKTKVNEINLTKKKKQQDMLSEKVSETIKKMKADGLI